MDRTKMISDNQKVTMPRKSLDLDSIMVGIEEYLNEIDSNEGEEIKVNIVKDEDENSVATERNFEDENEAEIALEREKAASTRSKKMPASSEDAFTVEDKSKKAEKLDSSEETNREVESEDSATEKKGNSEAEIKLAKSVEDITGTEADATGKLDAREAQKPEEAATAAAVEDKQENPIAEKITDNEVDTEQMEKADTPSSIAEQEDVAKGSEDKPEDIVEDEADEYKAELNAGLDSQEALKSQIPKSASKISNDVGTKISTESINPSNVDAHKDEHNAEYKSDLPTPQDTNNQAPNKNAAAPIRDANDQESEKLPERNDEHVQTQEPIPEILETSNENTLVEPQTILDQETEELLKQLEMMESTTQVSNSNSTTAAEIRAFNETQPIYIYTSLAGGGYHMIPRTNRLATILTANRITFEYRDLGTDAEARSVWRSFAQGKTLPGIVRGRDDVIGNWETVEDANENYRLRELLYDSL
ncbi:hypothetical protein HG537_0D02080 [Torulaspora globosa]|uniref:Uncharacterized protein n=1 Tax=Torulaspora globosa TaxID=48254 RepID=A0A7H9HU03_9SACH|nr:hypothetical protein HG537_0D02080 [Torulaspora sp. CBS 2947]